MPEKLTLAPLRELTLIAFNAHLRELNLRFDRVSGALEARRSKLALTGHMDAGANRLTNVGRATSNDDAIPLGQLQEAIEELRAEIPTSEGEDEADPKKKKKKTSQHRRDTDDAIAQANDNLVPTIAPPEIETSSALGTTITPPSFALSDHTHSGANLSDAQTIGGQKTLSLSPIISPLTVGHVVFVGTSQELDGDAALFWDDSTKRLGIGTATPGVPLDVVGKIRTTTQLESTVATGTAPLVVASTTVVTNLNADLLDGFNSTVFVRVTDTVSLTAQVADITDTAFGGTSAPGIYRISVYALTTTADAAAGTITVNIKYTDNAAAQTVTVGPVTLVTLGAFAQSTIFVRLNSGSITYGVTHTGVFGTSQYALYSTCERLA